MFIIIRRYNGLKSSDVYHKLKAKDCESALLEAAKYLSNGGAPVIGDPEDVFEVVQVISKPVRAEIAFLASEHKDRVDAAKVLLVILKEGEQR